MAVSEFTFKQAQDLIKTPKVILESDGKTVCTFKHIDCTPGLHENITLRSQDEEFLFLWTINRSSKRVNQIEFACLRERFTCGDIPCGLCFK